MGVNGMLTAGEVLLQWRLPRGFNSRLMDYPLGSTMWNRPTDRRKWIVEQSC